jgi:hypothetical protein
MQEHTRETTEQCPHRPTIGGNRQAGDRNIKAGEAPSLSDIYDLYSDAIDLNAKGRYLVACTFCATLCREDPTGLPFAGYGLTEPRPARVIRQTAWEVVRLNEPAGVAKVGPLGRE